MAKAPNCQMTKSANARSHTRRAQPQFGHLAIWPFGNLAPIPPMPQSFTRWTIFLLCLCIVGPAAGALTGALRASDGSHAASPLFCTSPAIGLATGLAALGLALVMGLLAA